MSDAMAEGDVVQVLNGDKPRQTTVVSATDLSKKLQKSMLRMKGEFMTDDGKGVNYKTLAKSKVFEEYKTETQQLHNVDLDGLSQEQMKVFCINIYNALTIHGLVEQSDLPDSVLKVRQFWKTIAYNIGGHVFTLDDLEHGILRSNRPHPNSTDAPFPADDSRRKYALLKFDPRIHFALVCGAKSCPAIQVYTEENLDAALDAAARNFCKQEVSMFTESNEIWLSMLFQWYRQDFGDMDTDVIRWIIPFLEPNIQDRANILVYKLEMHGRVDIKYNTYDWSLNSS